MSGENGSKNSEPLPAVIQLVITYRMDTDGCQVAGPLMRPGLCYAALELAKDVVKKYNEDMKKRGDILPPPPEVQPVPPGSAG